MMQLTPMSLATFVVGVATIFLGAYLLPDGIAQAALVGAGCYLVGLVTRGPGLVTKTQAERMSVRPPPGR